MRGGQPCADNLELSLRLHPTLGHRPASLLTAQLHALLPWRSPQGPIRQRRWERVCRLPTEQGGRAGPQCAVSRQGTVHSQPLLDGRSLPLQWGHNAQANCQSWSPSTPDCLPSSREGVCPVPAPQSPPGLCLALTMETLDFHLEERPASVFQSGPVISSGLVAEISPETAQPVHGCANAATGNS